MQLCTHLPEAAKTEILITAKEAQIRLGIGSTTLHKFVGRKWLTPVRFSKRLVRYLSSEVDALIQKFSKKSGAA